MNQSIRCEPLTFPGISEKAAGEAALCPAEENSNFGEVLDAELETAEEPSKDPEAKAEKKELEPWEVFGIAPVVPRIIEVFGPFPAGVESDAAEMNAMPETGLVATDSTEGILADAILAESGVLEEGFESLSDRGRPPSNLIDPSPGLRSQFEVKRVTADLKPGEPPIQKMAAEPTLQKVPSENREARVEVAQIALKAADPARIAGGMVAAQGTSMLLASPKQEEKAPERETALSLGLERFETASFETPVRATTPLRREAGLRKEIELTDISAIANDLPEQPGLEMISESQEAQPARPVEAASMAESIRTHVQVLKSSSQERLEVVLRPDTNTELHLRIEHVNGRIQIQARCDRGDFAILDANWNTIQSTLAAQGIRVEPLQTSSGAQFHQESSLDSDHQSSRRQGRENNFIEQEIADRKVTRQQVAGGSAVRGWQSWA